MSFKTYNSCKNKTKTNLFHKAIQYTYVSKTNI